LAKPARRKQLSAAEGSADLGPSSPVVPARFPIVGVGASAGGLDAFQKFFSTMPADSGVAFVLIQHLDPTRGSLTAELVGAHTAMRVVEAKDRMPVEPNRIYVIPPNKYLSLHAGALRLTAPDAPRSLRMAVDFFFHSLADDGREDAIGIILSGTGTDGSLGLKEIKSAGGMTMVQDPDTAQHDGMPRSAVATGSADYVLPAEQMADALLRYVRHAAIAATPTNAAPPPPPGVLLSAVQLICAHTKLDFSGFKTATLRRRIHRRMSLRRLQRMSAYVDVLRTDPAEVVALSKDLMIGVTSFFREPAAWQTLQERAIRSLIATRPAHVPLRVWVPACATGEEAYSIAIVLLEEIAAAGKNFPLQVFATDVDADALETGRAGSYPEGIEAHVSPERLTRFFVKDGPRYRVTKALREAVMFAPQSLLTDPPFSRLDLISCRNLFIYLEPAAQERLIPLLHFALVPDGYLFLGSAEGIGTHADLFEAVVKKHRIYRRIGSPREETRFPVAAIPFALQGSTKSAPPSERLAVHAPRLLLERYAPACVIIDRNAEILYFHGRTADYLTQPSGPPTRDLTALVRNGLRSHLRAAVRESVAQKRTVVVTGQHVRRGETFHGVTTTIEPLTAGTEVHPLWLVSFEDEATAAHTARVPLVADAAEGTVVSQLEHELKTTKDELQQTIEDLKSANEELMSVNEELQSSNEEMETSKEELQSLNEELTTTNGQLESKLTELEAAHNDLDNLLISTNIATIFLDTELRIRRFTPAANGLFNLIPSDLGRALADVTQKFTDPNLLSDVAAVLRGQLPANVEVCAHDGRWYVRQVLPYRTRAGQTEGVVVTFSDVAAEALREARRYAESIVDTVREPLVVLDEDAQVISANESFYNVFRVAKEQTEGRSLYELGHGEWNIPRLRTLLGEVLPQQHVLNDFEVTHAFESIGMRTMLLNARVLRRGGERPDLILLAIEDVTRRNSDHEALRANELRQRMEEQVRLRQAELAHGLRITTIGELASGLAHELNQPLSAIANGVEACARYVRAGKGPRTKLLSLLDDAAAESLRAAEIVEHLRGFIQKGQPRLERADLREIARVVPRLVAYEMERARITFELGSCARPLGIRADRIQIEQVVVNLLQNAIDAVREIRSGPRVIRLEVRSVKGTAELAVTDTGRGLSAEAAERLFDPFFTTKAQGLGMGLAISRSIIEAHHGKIWVEHADGRGTTVRFALPRQRAKATRSKPNRKLRAC
jgi:two-component system CheB/CheR fusion protein